MPELSVKHASAAALRTDGMRVLVERHWPVGKRRDDVAVDLWLRDEGPGGHEEWTKVVQPPTPRIGQLIQAGPEHFVAVLEGAEPPILTAEQAAHVLEIILAAGQSIETGCAVETGVTGDG